MKKDSKKVDLVVWKGNADVEGAGLKSSAMNVVMKFVSMALDLPQASVNHTMVIKGLDSSKPGDALWLRDKVFRKVDIKQVMDEKTAHMKAEKLISIYNEVNDGQEKVGLAIIKYFLEDMYMTYDVISW